MGVVNEAEQQSLGRRVALKVLPPHALNDGQQVRNLRRLPHVWRRYFERLLIPDGCLPLPLSVCPPVFTVYGL
jgi:hypothetical protein